MLLTIGLCEMMLKGTLILLGLAWGGVVCEALVLSEGAKRLQARVTSVVDGDTIVVEGGQEVRLLGIQAPEMFNKRTRLAEPFAEESYVFLRRLVMGEEVEIVFYPPHHKDRYRRLLGHIFLKGQWVQELLVSSGGAFVYSFADNREGILDLLKAEGLARRGQVGLWAYAAYQIQDSKQVERNPKEGFAIVQGKVLQVSEVRNKFYVNFGEDWRKDFSFMIAREHLENFGISSVKEGARVFEEWIGCVLRVRGWIRQYYGPFLEITHPEVIELVPKANE